MKNIQEHNDITRYEPWRMRIAFEQWMRNEEKWVIGSTDPYAKFGEEVRWRGWCAALAENKDYVNYLKKQNEELVGHIAKINEFLFKIYDFLEKVESD